MPLDLSPGTVKFNLAHEWRGCPIFCGNWNDVISSVQTNAGRVSLRGDKNLQGRELIIGSFVSVNLNTRPFGSGTNWDNKTSSLAVHE